MLEATSKHVIENQKNFKEICSKNLQQKKIMVMKEIKKLGLDKENEYDKYKYASAEQTKDEIRPLLAKHGITLSPTEKKIEMGQTQTSQGKTTNYCLITLEITLINADCPWDKETTQSTGYAHDRGDKALPKAKTTAIKYFLWNTFVMSYGDELEEDSHETISFDRNLKVEARRRLLELTATTKKAKEFLEKHFKGKKFDMLTPEELENLIELINKEMEVK